MERAKALMLREAGRATLETKAEDFPARSEAAVAKVMMEMRGWEEFMVLRIVNFICLGG